MKLNWPPVLVVWLCCTLPLATAVMRYPNNSAVLAWGSTTNSQTSVPTGARSGIVGIAGGNNHSLALTSGGEVLAWGDNTSGQTSVPAGARSGVVGIAAGYAHSLALTSSGEVLAWGGNWNFQTSVPAGARSGIIAIAAGYAHTLALTSNGEVLAWGHNSDGQLSVPAGALSGIIAIATGDAHSLALTSGGEVLAWGYSGWYGRTSVPTGARSGVVAIAAGQEHSLALTSGGEVLAWGDSSDSRTSVPAGARSGVLAIAAGHYHSLALAEPDWCLGERGYVITDRLKPGIGTCARHCPQDRVFGQRRPLAFLGASSYEVVCMERCPIAEQPDQPCAYAGDAPAWTGSGAGWYAVAGIAGVFTLVTIVAFAGHADAVAGALAVLIMAATSVVDLSSDVFYLMTSDFASAELRQLCLAFIVAPAAVGRVRRAAPPLARHRSRECRPCLPHAPRSLLAAVPLSTALLPPTATSARGAC